MSALKTFRIKRKLAKKQKQNRPIPQWIRCAEHLSNVANDFNVFLQDEDWQHHPLQRQEETLEAHQARSLNCGPTPPRHCVLHLDAPVICVSNMICGEL